MSIIYRHPDRHGPKPPSGDGSKPPSPEQTASQAAPPAAGPAPPSPRAADAPGEHVLGLTEVRVLCRAAIERLDLPCHVDEDATASIAIDPIVLRLWARPWPNSPGGCVVLVAADVLHDVRPSGDLALDMLRHNHDVLFGAFSLRPLESGLYVLGFDHVLLGDHITLAEIENAMQFVATTARRLAPELAEKYGGTLPLHEPDFPISRMTAAGHFENADPAALMAEALHQIPIGWKPSGDYWIHQGHGFEIYLGCFVNDAGRVTVAVTPRSDPDASRQFADKWMTLLDPWRRFLRGSSATDGADELLAVRQQGALRQLTPASIGPLPEPEKPDRGRRRR